MSRVSILRTVCVVCVAALALPSLAHALDVRTSRAIDYGKSVSVRPAIVQQCQLQTIVPAAVEQNSSRVQLIDGRGNLHMEITGAHGPGGGVFSGPKWVQVTGKLTRGGKTYTFRAKRFSAVDPFGGTCKILAKCARAVGADIASWLDAPTTNAVLGDAK